MALFSSPPVKLISSSQNGQRAFTLIEMMTVLVLIGIMIAMIIPEMKGTFEDALLRSTSRDLVSVCVLISVGCSTSCSNQFVPS